ncbi:hypothetical protein J1605_006721 [Eschrichtius robustus]|uniref:Uncharacterized protein n=1 Tax=Eschrichtius robustus TaxID=9764 RepID=A0AB34H294_ESCRO|nr:hypothetical protein J1605_006721 [Eschrichtius robustus]
MTARCPSSLPGSRDENNPIYVAPAMNGPVKRPERTLKEKKCFKLTGDVLGITEFNLLFGWSISDYRTFLSSAVTVVGLLMGISHHKEVKTLFLVSLQNSVWFNISNKRRIAYKSSPTAYWKREKLSSFAIILCVVLMVLVIINLFVSAILMAFGKERKSFKTQTEAALADMLLLKLSSLSGKQQHQDTYSSVYGTWHYQRVNTAGVVQDKPALLPNKHHVTSFMFQEDCGKYESEVSSLQL